MMDFPLIVSETNFFGLNYSAGYTYGLFFGMILVNKKCRNYSNKAIVGLMAHELSHGESLNKMNFRIFLKFLIKWMFTKKGKSEFETLADRMTIEKGYAQELYALRLNINKKATNERKKIIASKGYMSSKQIRQYAENIGKW